MDNLLILFLGIISTIARGGCDDYTKYDNYSLIRLKPHTEQQLEIIRQFSDPGNQVEILKRSYGVNDTLDILVPRSHHDSIKYFAESNYLKFDEKGNYGRSFEQLEPDSNNRYRRLLKGFNVYGYNSYSLIQENLDNIARSHPNLVKIETVGNSYQGRRMKLVKISKDPAARNPIIFVDAGIHAREWVAPAMAMYMINRLSLDSEALNNELNGVDWYILPVVNPDGYEYTRASRANRLWRKTRSKTNVFNCYGVDGNRNYGFKWGASGVSNNPCDQETYAGHRPFSEPETRAVKKIMLEHANRIKLYVSLHAYGQYLVYPWGYTGNTLPGSWKQLNNLATKVSAAVERAGGRPFRVMSAGQWYPAAGGSDDFAFGVAGIPYSYTMELTDGYEFQFPETHLRTVLPQFYEGFRVFSAEIKKEFSNRNSRTVRQFTTMLDED